MRHFRTVFDLNCDEIHHLVEMALRVKHERTLGRSQNSMAGRVLGLLFEKPSLRTRVSFESAIAHLGGSSIFLTREEVGLGKRETVADFARVISQYVDLLAVRTFAHSNVEELAKHASCPVINALSDTDHPCQALADLCTIREIFGKLEGIRIVFVGDGNNVARSLASAALMCNMQFVLSAPDGYGFDSEFIDQCHKWSNGGQVEQESDPARALAGADVVYTDVWASMGQEAEQKKRERDFKPYQVTAALMAKAKPEARFLHCLPAHRGEEVVSEVIDGPQSVVVQQAANRLHAQKALILWLLHQASAA